MGVSQHSDHVNGVVELDGVVLIGMMLISPLSFYVSCACCVNNKKQTTTAGFDFVERLVAC